MAEKIGSIPEEITYVFAGSETARTYWDMDWDHTEEDVIKEVKVTSTFPVAAGNKKRLETARQWAKTQPRGKIQEVTRKNEPFSVQICALEIRDRGGRAYKVLDDEGHYFDLREDVLLETLLSSGCEKDGRLKGKFLWCVIGSQTKLVREGSGLHETMKKANEDHNAKPIKKGDLQPGGVYAMKNLEQRIFVGNVTNGKDTYLLWFNTFDGKLRAKDQDQVWSYRLTKDCSVIKKTGQVKVDPDKLLKAYKDAAAKRIQYAKDCITHPNTMGNQGLKKLYEEGYERDKKEYGKVLALTEIVK